MSTLDDVRAALAGDRARKVAYPRRLHRLQVLGTAPVGAGLLRVRLGGDDLAGLTSHPEAVDEHVKLLFPDPVGGALRLPEQRGEELAWPTPRPTSRDYSVRRRTADALEVDVMLHPGGLASDWAAAAAPGDDLWLVGPPDGLVVPTTYDRYLFAGDLAASPVVARWLETAPAGTRGWALVEVAGPHEEHPLTGPPGVEVRWVHRGDAPPGTTEVLVDAVRAVEVPDGASLFVWAAGEASCLRPLRRWARDERGLPRAATSISGWWKRGSAGTPAGA